MKQSNNINRAICWLLAMALAMLPTLAQGSRQLITTPDGKKYILSSSQPERKWVDKGGFWVQQPINQIPQKVEENEGTVTIKYEWDFGNHDASCQSFSYLGQNDHWAKSVFGNSFQIPAGEYDFTSSAIEYNTSGYSYYIVVKEKVIINKDTTIVFHIDEASNLIDIADHHPNGELFKYPDNYSAVMVNTGLQRKNDKSHLEIMIPTTFYSGIYNCLYLSPVSDRFKFFQGRIYITEDYGENPKTYVTFYTSDNPSTHMENNETDYVCIKEHFEPSKESVEEAGDKGFGADLNVMFGEENPTNNGLYMWLDSLVSDAEIYVNAPQVNEETLPLHALFGITMIDYLQIVGYFPWGEPRYSSRLIQTPWFMIQDGKPLYMHLGLNGIPMFWWYSDGAQVIFPLYHNSHPFFFKDKEKKQDFGSTVPIFAYYKDDFSVGGVMLGRNGENRDIDVQLTTNLTLYENGEEVWSGQMLDYGQNAVYSEATGIIEGVYDNQNVIVDGLQGQNKTTIHYDASIENDIAPTLTFLWFKDINGDVNDRLQNASGGILEFSAGDFVPQVNSSTGGSYYTCNPLNSVEVLYSPYKENTWSELEVEEVPENFCSPGYGYFYRGSLAGVTGEALKGWFDLKVKLTDAAGNWQEQVISPAFRIDDLAYTSVATVGSDNAREVARYSIDGKRVDATHRGVTIIKMSDGTAKKIVQ